METSRLEKIRRNARRALGPERSDRLGDEDMGAVVGAVLHSISPLVRRSDFAPSERGEEPSAFEKAVVEALSHLAQGRNSAIARGMPSRERLREMIDRDEDHEVEAGSFEALAALSGKSPVAGESLADLRDPNAPKGIVERGGVWYVTGPQWSGPWFSEECAELASDGEFTLAHDENVRAHAAGNDPRGRSGQGPR